ncbi:hypothetical protein AMEX_G9727 [Astyanax mexicanus]|uniref:Uncharacterized protein n=1 Tax=Astyanax mexicanus TaxID=7994 RepID=A0A8T2LU42_ASTMX|nr:hypothetical protein AMEX_G9727 [Astyanax mexicanus]
MRLNSLGARSSVAPALTHTHTHTLTPRGGEREGAGERASRPQQPSCADQTKRRRAETQRPLVVRSLRTDRGVLILDFEERPKDFHRSERSGGYLLAQIDLERSYFFLLRLLAVLLEQR